MSPTRVAVGPYTGYQTDNFIASGRLANRLETRNQTHRNIEGTSKIKSMQTESKMDARAGRYAGAKSARRLLGEPG